jgi:hypothetical protein
MTLAAMGLFGAAKTPPKNDAAIESSIRARFSKSKIGANGFVVRVQNGVATVTGKTEVIQHKGVATRLAKAGGATAVVNKIEISAAARAKAAKKLAAVREERKPERKAEPASPAAKAPAQATASTPTSPPSAPEPPAIRRAVIKH